MKISFWNIFSFLVFVALMLFIFDGWKDNSVFEFMKSSDERLTCDEGIRRIASNISDESIKYKMVNVETNIVKFPLNKGEVMVEYCITIANHTSQMGGLWVTVQFLDKDDNVLSEDDERIDEIPGMRTKTVYGSVFTPISLAEEMTRVQVTAKR